MRRVDSPAWFGLSVGRDGCWRVGRGWRIFLYGLTRLDGTRLVPARLPHSRLNNGIALRLTLVKDLFLASFQPCVSGGQMKAIFARSFRLRQSPAAGPLDCVS